MSEVLFPFYEYWHLYLGFTFFIVLILLLDLGVFHKEAHVVSIKESSIWTVVWISLALLFNYGFYLYVDSKFGDAELSKKLALEFLTGFVIEKSLAVDNIFVFVVVFGYFAIPQQFQHRVLFYGILGALIFRAIFIALGSQLMSISWMPIVFGAFLILTGFKIMFAPEKQIRPEDTLVIKLLKKIIPTTSQIDGKSFFVKINNVIHATPLFVALIFLELTDIIFAVDSVPAIFAITKEPLIVFTSNIFAILGLRSMYFMLGGMVDKFAYLKYGLSLVLIFVGVKMSYLNELYGGKFPILWSLSIIAFLIFGSAIVSLVITKKKQS